MSKVGYVKVFRSINFHWLSTHKPYCYAFAWIDLIMMANYNGDTGLLNKQVAHIERGQLITTHRDLMQKWGWGNTKLRTFLRLLREENMIKILTDEKSNHSQTLIEIVNYSKYQDDQITNIYDDKSKPNQNQITNRVYMYKEVNKERIYKEKEINKEKESLRKQELFNQFWSEYPRKVSKQEAIKAFSKVSENEIPLLMEVLKKYKCSAGWLDNGGRFIPHPATWLNQRRWEDEIDIQIDQNPVNCINPKNSNEVILTNGSIYAKNYCVFENGQWRRK